MEDGLDMVHALGKRWARRPARLIVMIILATPAPAASQADVKLPAIFGDHMVLQRGGEVPVWGRAEPGGDVAVEFRGRRATARVGEDGSWRVMIDPGEAGGPFEMVVAGENTVTFRDVLVGEVWICSGQSNMHWPVADSADAALEIAAARHPDVRLISVPTQGSQEPREDFEGAWKPCSPETVGDFSAVGYFFGRQLRETLGVPIGLVRVTWSNSPCEAWIPRDRLAADPVGKSLIAEWEGPEKEYEEAKARGKLDEALAARMVGHSRPGNLFNGMIRPVLGYGVRGVIWYQGEANAPRAHQYHALFPLLVRSWRDRWGRGDFPFYWAQIADFMAEKADPADSAWAELREAQTAALALPNTGQAVTIDLGEANSIHPRRKQEVARRLARWALARDYSVDVPCQSPTFRSLQVEGGKVALTFDHVGTGLRAEDVDEVRGFAVAGTDRNYAWAQARIVGPDRVEVWSDQVAHPVAARYAWADNPVCNLVGGDGLPATPFRTDDWAGVSALSRRQKALRVARIWLPTVVKAALGALAAGLAFSFLGLLPWSRINAATIEVDARTGRTRSTRHLFWLPVFRKSADTPVSQALGPDDQPGRADWRLASTRSPWRRISPRHDFHDAPAMLRTLVRSWDERGADAERRRSEAQELILRWREEGCDAAWPLVHGFLVRET
jgi:sialate O-acetylesterase